MDKLATRAFFENLRTQAKRFISKEERLFPKKERTFNKTEIYKYLGGIDKTTFVNYAEMAGLESVSERKEFTLKEAYAVRNALRSSERVHAEPKFQRSDKQSCQIICVQNQKGGVGKSTYSVNSASGLAIEIPKEYRVGIVDLDPQHNASKYWVENLHLDEHYSVGDLMALNYELEEGENEAEFLSSCFLPTPIPNLRILPASQNHRSHEYTFHREFALGYEGVSPYLRLKSILDQVQDEFDIIIIDTPPSSGFVTINAYAAATSVVFPVMLNKVDIDATCGYFNFIPELWDMLENLGHIGYDFTKIILTNVDQNSDSESETEAKMIEEFSRDIFSNSFVSSEAIKVCNNHRSTVFEMSKSQYPKTKKSFERCELNVRRVVMDLHREILKVWEAQEAGK